MHDGEGKQAKREPAVRLAIGRLENLAQESEQIVERLQSTFAPVLFIGPPNELINVRDTIPGSELSQVLMRIADQIDVNLRSIREIIESADI